MIVDLKVPLSKQSKNSRDCGQHCAKMILDSFGKLITIEEINKLCRYTRGGTLESSLALALLRGGTVPTIYTLPDNETFFAKYRNTTPVRMAASFDKRARKSKSKIQRRGLADFAELSRQERIKFEAPVPRVIKRELDLGHPWIAGVNVGSFYGDNQSKGVGHFVVIRGYNNDKLLINDPARGKLTIFEDLFLYSHARMEGIAICVSDGYS